MLLTDKNKNRLITPGRLSHEHHCEYICKSAGADQVFGFSGVLILGKCMGTTYYVSHRYNIVQTPLLS